MSYVDPAFRIGGVAAGGFIPLFNGDGKMSAVETLSEHWTVVSGFLPLADDEAIFGAGIGVDIHAEPIPDLGPEFEPDVIGFPQLRPLVGTPLSGDVVRFGTQSCERNIPKRVDRRMFLMTSLAARNPWSGTSTM